jgi:hypothetical protein
MENKHLYTDKSYYAQGFTTTIKRATKKEQELKEDFGFELISKYNKIDRRLLVLREIDNSYGLSTSTHVYLVKMGLATLGKLYITEQYLTDDWINLMYSYRYRVSSYKYRQLNNQKLLRFNNKTAHQEVRARKRISNNKIKRYKER